MPLYPVSLPPHVPGATQRRLIVKLHGAKLYDTKFSADTNHATLPLKPGCTVTLVDSGITVAIVDIPKKVTGFAIPPRPCDVPPKPPEPEPEAPKPRVKPNLQSLAAGHLLRRCASNGSCEDSKD